MKTLSILVAIALGLGAAGSVLAQPNTTINPGKIPKLRHQYVPKYDIVTGQGVKIRNPGTLQGLNPQPLPPGKALVKPGSIKSLGGPDT